jgi:RHS repeat-associated protein
MGRRIMKTVTGTTTGYMYDGINAVQELSGTTPSANLLTGLAIDETFMRTDAGGNRHFLSDALGSTLALTDDGGTTQTGYNYEPYGTTTTSGAASNNSITYTGREYDNTGLYYYRARYYSPTLQRFISEDPIGLAGGINTHAYVEGNPISRVDPTGLAPPSGAIALRDYFQSIFPSPRDPSLRPDGLPCGYGCGDAKSDAYVPDFFPKSCAAHDDCYGDQRGKALCDANFKRDMKAERPDMSATATIYYWGVYWGGGGAYREAGKKP